MVIGTSDGEQFESEFELVSAQYIPKPAVPTPDPEPKTKDILQHNIDDMNKKLEEVPGDAMFMSPEEWEALRKKYPLDERIQLPEERQASVPPSYNVSFDRDPKSNLLTGATINVST